MYYIWPFNGHCHDSYSWMTCIPESIFWSPATDIHHFKQQVISYAMYNVPIEVWTLGVVSIEKCCCICIIIPNIKVKQPHESLFFFLIRTSLHNKQKIIAPEVKNSFKPITGIHLNQQFVTTFPRFYYKWNKQWLCFIHDVVTWNQVSLKLYQGPILGTGSANERRRYIIVHRLFIIKRRSFLSMYTHTHMYTYNRSCAVTISVGKT